jgi:hypothetical protein
LPSILAGKRLVLLVLYGKGYGVRRVD